MVRVGVGWPRRGQVCVLWVGSIYYLYIYLYIYHTTYTHIHSYKMVCVSLRHNFLGILEYGKKEIRRKACNSVEDSYK
jgi:hypothetical protein